MIQSFFSRCTVGIGRLSKSTAWLLPRGKGAALAFVALSLLLVTLGLIVLSSASQAHHLGVFKKQLFFLALAISGGLISFNIELERLYQWAPYLLGISLLALLLVLNPLWGVRVNGAQRWLALGGVRMQPSELAKVGLAVGLSAYLYRYQTQLTQFSRGFLPPMVLLGIFCLLMLLEPDFGTAFLCGAVGGSLLFLAGVRWHYLLCSALSGVSVLGFALSKDPVRLRRITAFLDVEGNRSDSAYQLWQGILGFGVGGLQGLGIGKGRQQMAFLPEAHTDFILSVIGEEMGLFYTAGVVLIFSLLVLIGAFQLRKAPNLFEFLLVAAALLFISLQALMNMAVVTGLVPTKGISLPFISYGGSNLIVMGIFVGLVANAFCRWSRAACVPTLEF